MWPFFQYCKHIQIIYFLANFQKIDKQTQIHIFLQKIRLTLDKWKREEHLQYFNCSFKLNALSNSKNKNRKIGKVYQTIIKRILLIQNDSFCLS